MIRFAGDLSKIFPIYMEGSMAGGETGITLGPFRIDLPETQLLRDGIRLELRPQAFRALEVLIRNHGKLVDYGQMMREAWGFQVSKHTIATTVNELKSVLGEYGSWITCQPKFGYRLTMRDSEDLLRKGWHFWNQHTRKGLENALDCFQQAAEKDSSDFRAFEAISSSCLMLAGFLMRQPRECQRLFEQAHQRAVELCGMTPELRLERAFGLLLFEHDLKQAEAELKAVRRERPSLVHAPIRLALVYLASGRLDQARATMLEAQAIDDLAPQLAMLGMVVRLFRREFQTAEEWGRANLELHPSSGISRAFYAECLELTGRFDEALTQYKSAMTLSPDALWILADQAACFARHGRKAEALATLDELATLRRTAYVDAYHVALLLDAVGLRQKAFQELERALDEMAYSLLFIDVDPKADAIRDDRRFAQFRKKLSGIGIKQCRGHSISLVKTTASG
ncbi:MAG: winged helix-turn-helix domain-containing protein [Acidobacteriia bacterium]|nr:winged helix-turn-helix domain-containing protein [Terriglobia bacterium]